MISVRNVILEFRYRNWKGEYSKRRVKPERIYWSTGNQYHPQPQWLMRAYDFDKREHRDFAMADMSDVREPRIEDGQNGRLPAA